MIPERRAGALTSEKATNSTTLPSEQKTTNKFNAVDIKPSILELQNTINSYHQPGSNAARISPKSVHEPLDLANIQPISLPNYLLKSGIIMPGTKNSSTTQEYPMLISPQKWMYFFLLHAISSDHHRDKATYLYSMVNQYNDCKLASAFSPHTYFGYASKSVPIKSEEELQTLTMVYESFTLQEMVINKRNKLDETIVQEKVFNEKLGNDEKEQLPSDTNYFSSKKTLGQNSHIHDFTCGYQSLEIHGLKIGFEFEVEVVRITPSEHHVVYRSGELRSETDYFSFAFPVDVIRREDLGSYMISVHFYEGEVNETTIKIESCFMGFGAGEDFRERHLLEHGLHKSMLMLYNVDPILHDSRGYSVHGDEETIKFIKSYYLKNAHPYRYVDNCVGFYEEHLIRYLGRLKRERQYDEDALGVYVTECSNLFNRFITLANIEEEDEVATKMREFCEERGLSVPYCYEDHVREMDFSRLHNYMRQIEAEIILAKETAGLISKIEVLTGSKKSDFVKVSNELVR